MQYPSTCMETHIIYIYISIERYIPEVEMKIIYGLPQAAPKKKGADFYAPFRKSFIGGNASKL